MPRLRGWGGNLSRQAGGRVGADGGGIGGRGPGETKIETDRRRIRTRIAKLRREIKAMQGHPRDDAPGALRATTSRRWRSPATPTPASPPCSTASPAPACWWRTRCSPPSTRPPGGRAPRDGRVYTLSDTVGFVRHLPHQLVEAFRSTLEEVADADLILHVVDGSHPDPGGAARRGARGAAPRSAPTTSPSSSSSTRPTRPTRSCWPGCAPASRTASSCRRARARASRRLLAAIEADLPRADRRVLACSCRTSAAT